MKHSQPTSIVLAFPASRMSAVAEPLTIPRSNERIESTFRETYVYRTFLKNESIGVNANDGVLTLTGSVAEEFHKELAGEAASNLLGVTRVENNLSSRAAEAAANSDTWIGRKVKLSLLMHRNVSALSTGVEVNAGTVVLSGEAENLAQKELAGEYAGDIDGVKSVDNRMTLADAPAATERTAGEKMDDASITAHVRTALLNHRSTSTVRARVSTVGGEVTLTGIASNTAERALVAKLAGDINGVTSVRNDMTVEMLH